MGDTHFLSGKKKAALFLLGIGKDTSRKVMEYLDRDSMALVMEQMKDLSAEDISMMDSVCHEIAGAISGNDPKGVSDPKDMDPETLAGRLSQLPPEKASSIMKKLPGRIRAEVSRKITAMDKERNFVLKERIRNHTMTFDEIDLLDDGSIRQVLSEAEFIQLDKALRTASSEVREKFLRNMHPHLADELRNILRGDGTVSFNESEQAQKEILGIVFMLFSKK